MDARESDHPIFLDTTVRIFRCDDEIDILRAFSAAATTTDEDGHETALGSLTGWISRRPYSGIAVAGDVLSADTMILGVATEQIVEAYVEDRGVDAVVMIDRTFIEPEHRGKCLLGRMVDDLLEVLQFDPALTVVVVFPEPVPRAEGEPRPEGPERERGLRKLEAVLDAAGFAAWEAPGHTRVVGLESDPQVVWWRPFTDGEDPGEHWLEQR